jgi:hypothetical protein
LIWKRAFLPGTTRAKSPARSKKSAEESTRRKTLNAAKAELRKAFDAEK